MNQSPTIGALAAALAKAQKAIKPAIFDRTNPHFKNKYATLASIMDAIRGPLADNGIAILQGAEAEGPVVKVTTRLVHASGEWLEATLSMTAQQNTPQGVMAALTYCRRGSLSLVSVVSDDDDDGEQANRPAPHRDEPKPSTKPAPGAMALWSHLVNDCGGDKEKAKVRLDQAAHTFFGTEVPPTAKWTDEDCVKVNALLFPDIKF